MLRHTHTHTNIHIQGYAVSKPLHTHTSNHISDNNNSIYKDAQRRLNPNYLDQPYGYSWRLLQCTYQCVRVQKYKEPPY